jgi:hypothetical protein
MVEGDSIRIIIPHRGIDDDCGSLEVWFAEGRVSVRFYWDNLVSRLLRPECTSGAAIGHTTLRLDQPSANDAPNSFSFIGAKS